MKTIAVDFDGVIHAYSRGWEDGVIYDNPKPHALESIIKLSKEYKIVVFTARDHLVPVRDWLREQGFEPYIEEVTNLKPKAMVYIDDRAIHFNNWHDALQDIGLSEDEMPEWKDLNGNRS